MPSVAVRIRGYSLCFGTQDQDTRTAIAAECLPFSLASLEVAKHVATLRESIQLANVAIRAGETMMIPSGCLYLLFENGRMRVSLAKWFVRNVEVLTV